MTSIPTRGCLPETVKNTRVKSRSSCDVNNPKQRNERDRNGLSKMIRLPTVVNPEWVAVATACSNLHERQNVSSQLSSTRRYNTHPTAYIIKALAVSLSLHTLINENQKAHHSCGAELFRLSKMREKSLKHPASKIWERRSKLKLSESKVLMASSKVLNDLILMDLIRNFGVFATRLCGERLDAVFASSSHHSSSSVNSRDEFMANRIAAHKENMEWAKNLRDRLETSNDATKKIFHENYDSCSSCQTMYHKCLSPIFGNVPKSCKDSPSAPGLFLCLECEDRSPQNPITGSEKKSKRKRNKKHKRKKSPAQYDVIASDAHSKIQEAHYSTPQSPTSVVSPLCHQLDPKMEPLNLSPIASEYDETANNSNYSMSASHPVDHAKSIEVSNDDLVDYLIQSGSILALAEYMDELELDREDLGEGTD